MRPCQCLDANGTRTTAQVARIVYLDIHRVLEIVALQGVALDAQIEIRTTVRDTEERAEFHMREISTGVPFEKPAPSWPCQGPLVPLAN